MWNYLLTVNEWLFVSIRLLDRKDNRDKLRDFGLLSTDVMIQSRTTARQRGVKVTQELIVNVMSWLLMTSTWFH